jgi:hypothetical protein
VFDHVVGYGACVRIVATTSRLADNEANDLVLVEVLGEDGLVMRWQ